MRGKLKSKITKLEKTVYSLINSTNLSYADFYLSTGGATAITAPTTLVLNNTRNNKNNDISILSNVVTFSKSGTYEINADIYLNTSGTNRGEGQAWVELNSVEINGTRTGIYLRGLGDGDTGSISLLLSVSSGDTLRLRADRSNGIDPAIFQVDNGTRLLIKEV